MTEQSRDVGLADCTDVMAAGSAAVCQRIGNLEPAGGAATEIVRLLGAECPNIP